MNPACWGPPRRRAHRSSGAYLARCPTAPVAARRLLASACPQIACTHQSTHRAQIVTPGPATIGPSGWPQNEHWGSRLGNSSRPGEIKRNIVNTTLAAGELVGSADRRGHGRRSRCRIDALAPLAVYIIRKCAHSQLPGRPSWRGLLAQPRRSRSSRILRLSAGVAASRRRRASTCR